MTWHMHGRSASRLPLLSPPSLASCSGVQPSGRSSPSQRLQTAAAGQMLACAPSGVLLSMAACLGQPGQPPRCPAPDSRSSLSAARCSAPSSSTKICKEGRTIRALQCPLSLTRNSTADACCEPLSHSKTRLQACWRAYTACVHSCTSPTQIKLGHTAQRQRATPPLQLTG